MIENAKEGSVETTRTYKPGDVIVTPDGFRVEIVAVSGKRIRIRHPLADGTEIVAEVPVLTGADETGKM